MRSSEEKRTAAYVIELVSSVINGTEPPENDGLDYRKIIEFSEKQCVLNIVSYAIEKLKSKPDERTLKYLREIRMREIVVEAQQELTACDVCEKLSEMGVNHMLLKGSVLKNIYPSPDMRTMGDIDVLVEAERCGEICEAFVAEGYEFVGEGNLHSNVRKGNAYIEFHRSMVDERHSVLYSYYGDGFSRAVQDSENRYEYKLSDEDFYIFLIAHIAKHYRYGGTGIRTMLDLYVYEKSFTAPDFEYIEKELEKIGLLVFYRKIRAIAFGWFSGGFGGDFDIMQEYIISGGVYGDVDSAMQNSYIFDHIDENIRVQKIKTMFKIIFLDYSEMKIRYPFLDGKKILLPLFWIIRFFGTFLHKPKNVKQRLEDSKKILQISDEMVEIQKISGIEKL